MSSALEQTAPATPVLYAASDARDYWLLLKPNVMQLVVFTGLVGILLAPAGIHPILGFVAILCIAAGAGAAAAINNGYDADIDRQMVRTRKRPTADGRIDPAEALGAGITLGVLSVMVMGLALNWLAAGLLALTIVYYTLFYTMWLKRRTPQNIVIGGAAGAFPPLIGWAAVTGDLALMPIVLFAVIFMWTPPHFWVLSLYRVGDYAKVSVPMLPVVAGRDTTRQHIWWYTLVLVATTMLPLIAGAGWIYLLAAVLLGARFIGHSWRLMRRDSDVVALRTFKFSIVYLFALFSALVVDKVVMWTGFVPALGVWPWS